MTDAAAFIAAICADPSDDAPRLIYADWLDENAGEVPCRATGCNNGRVLRQNYEHVKNRLLPAAFDCEGVPLFREKCSACNGTSRVSNGVAERASMIRCHIQAEKDCPELATVMGRTQYVFRSHPLMIAVTAFTSDTSKNGLSPFLQRLANTNCLDWRRGFVSSLTLSWADCERHLDAIVAEHPVEAVTLTTVPDTFAMPGIRWPRIKFSAIASSQRWTEFRVRDDFTHSPSR
jgi:uncharacterized protein (TIGR02996 family)